MRAQQRTTRAVTQSRLAVLLRNRHRPTFIWKMVIWKKQKEVVIMQRDHNSRNCWLRMVTTRTNVKNKRLCLILDRRRWCIPSHQMFRELNNREFIFKTRTWCGVRVVDDFVYVITIKEVMFYFNNQPSWWYRRQLLSCCWRSFECWPVVFFLAWWCINIRWPARRIIFFIIVLSTAATCWCNTDSPVGMIRTSLKPLATNLLL